MQEFSNSFLGRTSTDARFLPCLRKGFRHDTYPPRRIGQPVEVAMTSVFLASDEEPFITIDGGLSVMYHD